MKKNLAEEYVGKEGYQLYMSEKKSDFDLF